MAQRRSNLDLNTASAEDLLEIEGVSAEQARALVHYREKRGGFESWEDVQQVAGFGGGLLETLRHAATIGARPGHEVDQELEAGPFTVTEAEDHEAEIETLLSLAQMDSEAAVAYETAAELVGEEHVAETLRSFGYDHRRHVDEIGRLVTEYGVELTLAAPEPETSTFATMVASIGVLGVVATLRAMIANEQFTNSAYEAALDLLGTSDIHALLERNFADEQRHLRWLLEELGRNRGVPEQAPGASAPA